jgi:hypothetical protein
MLLAGASALLGAGMSGASQLALLLGWVAIYLALMGWIDKRWQKHQLGDKQVANI